jgi:putative N6-adenine-specific DNA methylase
MSSDSQDPPRKTLSLSKPASSGDDAGRRKRTGARARLVAQIERAKDHAQRKAAAAAGEPPPAPPARNSRPSRPGAPASRAPSPSPRAPRVSASTDGPRARPDGPKRPGPPRPSTGARPDRSDRPAGRPTERTSGRTTDRPSGRNAERAAPRTEKPVYDPRRNQPTSTLPIAVLPIVAEVAERYTVFAPCPQGLEHALTAEMQALGFDDAQPGRAGCRFTADWPGVQRANLYSRLATRILVQVAHAPIQNEDDILELARATPWERWFGAEHTLRVDTSAIKSPMQSLQFCNLRAKDGICDRLRDYEGARPSIDTVRPDARVQLFLTHDTATLYLDTSGESLFKRGWRLDKGEAPLRENLAAGLLALAGWDPAAALLDPFCGSGTILIEAAWIALGIPPATARPLGFERLRNHDARRWLDMKDEAESRIRPELEEPLVGVDLDPAAIAFAKSNAERALLAEDAIRFEVGDARTIEAPADRGWIVTNPPYGDRMPLMEEGLWQDWASNLKRNFGGWELDVITSDMELPQQLRLKPQRRTPIFNGALDCRLFGFELVTASFRDK